MALLCGHSGRLTGKNGGFRPGQSQDDGSGSAYAGLDYAGKVLPPLPGGIAPLQLSDHANADAAKKRFDVPTHATRGERNQDPGIPQPRMPFIRDATRLATTIAH